VSPFDAKPHGEERHTTGAGARFNKLEKRNNKITSWGEKKMKYKMLCASTSRKIVMMIFTRNCH
jgi:hypothetical protein